MREFAQLADFHYGPASADYCRKLQALSWTFARHVWRRLTMIADGGHAYCCIKWGDTMTAIDVDGA